MSIDYSNMAFPKPKRKKKKKRTSEDVQQTKEAVEHIHRGHGSLHVYRSLWGGKASHFQSHIERN